jgi:TPR repeat protein
LHLPPFMLPTGVGRRRRGGHRLSVAVVLGLVVAGCAGEAALERPDIPPRTARTLPEACADQQSPTLCAVYPCTHGSVESCKAACAAGAASACESFGQRLCREGSVEDCDAACDAGNAEACRALGHLYAEGGRGITRDTGSATKLLRRACDLGGRRMCPVFEDPMSPLAASAGEVKSCELGGARACKELGDAYLRGELGQGKDADRAAQYYELACDPGLTSGPADATAVDACTAFARAAAVRAASSFEETCVGGSAGACKFVAEIAEKDSKAVEPEARVTALHRLCSMAKGIEGRSYQRYCGLLEHARSADRDFLGRE